MAASKTHNQITIRPPPGTRFTLFGQDTLLEFERGREREIVNWLRTWIDSYIEPEAVKVEQRQALEKQLAEDPAMQNLALQNKISEMVANAKASGELHIRTAKGAAGPGTFHEETYANNPPTPTASVAPAAYDPNVPRFTAGGVPIEPAAPLNAIGVAAPAQAPQRHVIGNVMQVPPQNGEHVRVMPETVEIPSEQAGHLS